MQDGTIGRRYARALALALGEGDLGAFQKVEEEMSALAELLEQRGGSGDFRQAMRNPSFSPEVRQRILHDIAEAHGFHVVTRQMLRLLVDKGRVLYLGAIARAFRAEVDERTGRVRAHIVSARVLEDAAVKQIVAALEKRTGKKVLPELEVEPEVLGGVAARIGGQVFDNTVRAQLDRMKSAMSA
jgi:F-type H+-transporting ATPase subunit delta